MALFSPWSNKGKKDNKNKTAIPQQPSARSGYGARKLPQTPRGQSAAAAPMTPRQNQPPLSARGPAPCTERFGGPAELLGVCHHNYPAPLLDPSDPKSRQIEDLPRHVGKVFRTVHINTQDLSNYLPGQVFRWSTWVSSTKERNNLHAYKGSSNCIFILHLTELTLSADISSRSSCAEEAEVLIAPNQFFKVATAESRAGIHYIHCHPHQPLTHQSGFHLLCRSNTFEMDETADIQDSIITLAERCMAIESPVYFEKQNEYAVAYIKHSDDQKEWKVIVIGDCAVEFLQDLKKSQPTNCILSILIYTQGADIPKSVLSQFPSVVEITNKVERILDFIQQPTVSTDVPQYQSNSPSPDSTGGVSPEITTEFY